MKMQEEEENKIALLDNSQVLDETRLVSKGLAGSSFE